jgi:glycosyltransferase involved in cell wall biosynthesis
MPCYNGADHLPISVSSIRQQTFGEWELVVVDDGSTDNSLQVLELLSGEDSRIHVFEQENAGPSAARNRALSNAKGEFIAFLDADDSWHPEFFEKMKGALNAHPNAGLAYCGWQNVGLTGGRGKPFVPPDYEVPNKVEVLLGGCRWPIHATLARKIFVERAGGFNEQLRSSEDFDLWLRLATGVPIVRVPRVLSYYRHHGDADTRDRAQVAFDHWTVKREFLHDRPDIPRRLGSSVIRSLVHGELLRAGYECYWKRDLHAARRIFRRVMRHHYGTPRDWLYMLPSLLPMFVHRFLLMAKDRLTTHGSTSGERCDPSR